MSYTSKANFTRLDNDKNGNPRYVIHFTHFLSPSERATMQDSGNISLKALAERYEHLYEVACKRAKKLGGRKYNTKAFGGGIAISSYSLDADINMMALIVPSN